MTDATPWPDTETEYLLTDARIVATLKKGGAIVEDGLTLSIREGRSWNTRGEHDDPTREEWLEYHFSFHVEDGTYPESMVSQKGQIVISGTHPNGSVLLIQGKGWVGYDEHGNPEGHFEQPPKVTVAIGPDAATRLKREAARMAALTFPVEGTVQ
ncbi:hypothetical protein SAMN05444678_11691 [Sphingomonas sp. YR710]|uniref:hypothetical protein n=1 Tax=Sphingomonas sp. YR710 TaxID=1882773 RepID=UPI00088CD533|nr:hypothetical protein [Sphingomonas sp. YR710]SDD58732.1 hypothetical protein SAMN05444678_11691 [Sphingomonas sp. YR710]